MGGKQSIFGIIYF